MPKKDSRSAAWVFGSIAFAVLIWIVLFGPKELPPARHQALGILCAILCGLFGYFFTGTIQLVTQGTIPKWGKVSIQAGGGAAFFVLVLFWWSSAANPVDIKKDIKNLHDSVEALPEKVADAVYERLSKSRLSGPPDFPTAFREAAEQFNITIAQAEEVVRKWVVEKQNSADFKVREKATFLARSFTEPRGFHELELAIHHGNSELVSNLLANFPALAISCRTNFLISTAAGGASGRLVPSEKRIRIIEALLENGAQINAYKPDIRQTLLFNAARLGHEAILAFVLGKGADPNIVSTSGSVLWFIQKEAENQLISEVQSNTYNRIILQLRQNGAVAIEPGGVAPSK